VSCFGLPTASEATPRQGAGRETPPAKPVEITWEGIRQRLTLPQVGLDVHGFQLSPDGNTLLLTAEVAGQENLYTYPLGESRREEVVARQLTSTAGPKTGAQFAPGGREVWYLERGRPFAIALETRTPRAVAGDRGTGNRL
jgi:tricorn protease